MTGWEIFGIVTSGLSILGVGGLATWPRWFRHRGHSLTDRVAERVAESLRTELRLDELRPNGGSSLVDRVTRLDEWRRSVNDDLREIKESVTRTDANLLRHLEAHSQGGATGR